MTQTENLVPTQQWMYIITKPLTRMQEFIV